MSAVYRRDENAPVGWGDALFEILRESYFSPLIFFRFFLRVPYLYRWQQRVCAKVERQLRMGVKNVKVIGRTNHGAGKDFLVAGLVIWFMYTRHAAGEEPRALTLAPTWTGIESLLWAELGRMWDGSLAKDLQWGKLLDTQLHLSKASFAIGMSSDRPGKLEGQHSPGAAMRVVDEAKEVEKEWFEATRGLLNAPSSFDIWISTPSIEDGEFHARDMSGDPSVIREKVSVDDLIADYKANGYPSLAGMEAWKGECLKDWGPDSAAYMSRCQAEYIVDAEGTLFPASWVERGLKLWFTPEANTEACTALDPAGSVDGDENATATVGHFTDGERLSVGAPMSTWHQRDTTISMGRFISAAREAKGRMRIDANGLGQGIMDAGRAAGHAIEEFRSTNKPRDDKQYKNRKAEEAWTFRKRLERSQVAMAGIPEAMRQKAKSQLTAMRYQIGRDGKIQVIDPKNSPDLADAILIAAAKPRKSVVGVSSLPIVMAR